MMANDRIDGEREEDENGAAPDDGAPPSRVENARNVFARKDIRQKALFKVVVVACVAIGAGVAMYKSRQSSAPGLPGQYTGVSTGGGADDPQPVDQHTALGAAVSPDQNPAIRGALMEGERQKIEADKAAGKSGSPSMDGFTPAPAASGASEPAIVAQAQQQVVPQQPSQADQQAQAVYAAYLQDARKAATSLLEPAVLKGSSTSTFAFAVAQPQAAAQHPSQQADAATPGQTATTQSGLTAAQSYKLIEAASLYAGQTVTGYKSTTGSGSIAIDLTTGPMAGARLLATVQREGETGAFKLRSLTIPGKGITVPAEGVVLDAASLEHGYATSVDRKAILKYVIKPFIGGLAAAGKAIQAMGTVSTNGVLGSTSQTSILTGRQIGQVIVGGAAEAINKDAEALNTDPVVTVKPREIVGILFEADVMYTPGQSR